MPNTITPEWIDAATKVAAIIGGAAFFYWKIIRGYNIVDLSLRPEVKRVNSTAASDTVIFNIFIEKGSAGSLSLKDIGLKIQYSNQSKRVALHGWQRLSYRSGSTGPELNWDTTSTSNPHLNLAPGDKTSFSTHFEVPCGEICAIECTVLGQRLASNWKGQWRCSAVVEPIQCEVK